MEKKLSVMWQKLLVRLFCLNEFNFWCKYKSSFVIICFVLRLAFCFLDVPFFPIDGTVILVCFGAFITLNAQLGKVKFKVRKA